MQLLAACQKSDTISRLVVKSTTAIYGCGPSDPAVFTEDMQPRGNTRSGYAQDAVEVESYVRGFARRRPDVTVSVLRLASVVGQHSSSPFARYLAMPVLPTVARLRPAAAAAARVRRRRGAAAGHRHRPPGRGERRRRRRGLAVAGHPRARAPCGVPVPAPALAAVGTLVRNSGVAEFAAEQASFLNYGRVVDTTRLHRVVRLPPAVDHARGAGRARRRAAAVRGPGGRCSAPRSGCCRCRARWPRTGSRAALGEGS